MNDQSESDFEAACDYVDALRDKQHLEDCEALCVYDDTVRMSVIYGIGLERARQESQASADVHTCHDQCQRKLCVMRREIVPMEKVKVLIDTLQEIGRHKASVEDELYLRWKYEDLARSAIEKFNSKTEVVTK